MRRMWMAVAAVGVLVGVGWGVVGGQEEGVGLVEAGVGRLVVGWEWEGAEVERFLVSWRERAGALWTVREVGGTARRFEIAGLRPGTAYVVRVRGLDARGRGVASGGRTSDLRGAFETLRRAGPSGLRIEQRWFGGTGVTVRIAWDAPEEAWGWSGWLVRWRELGAADTAWRSGSPAVAARSTLIGGLKENSAYLVRVAALDGSAESGSAESETAELRFTAARPLGKAAITSATWDGSTITAAWRAERSPAVYDVRFSIVEDDPASAGQPVLTYSIELETAETTASQGVPRQRPHRVQVRARIGSGAAAAVGEWSEPALVVLLPAPAAPAVSFDGERATATWDAVEGATAYELVWGAAGAAAAVRLGADERQFTTGALTAGTRYEFRLRVLNASGRSDLSSAAGLTPTAWPNAVPAATFKFYDAAGMLVEWAPVDGVDDYVVSWTKRGDASRSGETAATGSSVLATRDGGFFSGVWLLRVRVAGTGMWSDARSIWVQSPAPELRFWLESSRTLCTEGTLTEIRWRGGGGAGNLWPHINGRMIGEATYRVKVNCGMIPRTADGELDQTQIDAVITGHLLDGRGTIKSASIRIPRAPALPAPTDLQLYEHERELSPRWNALPPGSQVTDAQGRSTYLIRWRPASDPNWRFNPLHVTSRQRPAAEGTTGERGATYLFGVAALRHPIEAETPDALNWTPDLSRTVIAPPKNVVVTTTHDSLTVTFDGQTSPAARETGVWVLGASGYLYKSIFTSSADDLHQATFRNLSPDTEYVVEAFVSVQYGESPTTRVTVRTKPAPADWVDRPVGPQNIRTAATHNSITILWDLPHPDAEQKWVINVSEVVSGKITYLSIPVDPGQPTAMRFPRLSPATEYLIQIHHLGISNVEVPVRVTTLPAPAPPSAPAGQGASGSQGLPEPGQILIGRIFARPVGSVLNDDLPDRAKTEFPHAGRASTGCAGVSGGVA